MLLSHKGDVILRIEQFEYLAEISKNKSMNAASKELHLTPQALSISIKKLEEELNLTILDRTTMGVSLTEKGQALLLLVENFLSGLHELQELPLQKKVPICGPMNLSIPYGFTETYLPNLLKTIYADYPNMEITATPYCYADIISQVEANLSDYGLTYKIYINGTDLLQDIPDTLVFTPLYKAKFFCTIPESFPISKYKSISLKTMLDYPIIMYEPANYLMLKILKSAGTPARIINVPSLESTMELLQEGLGLAFCMYNMNDNHYAVNYGDKIRYISFKENISADFGYIVKKDKKLREDSLLQIHYLTKFFQN